jgi:RNA polymerase sigma-70 factor (ECF subfamily)
MWTRRRPIASRDGDLATLRTMLAEDILIQSDGGGRVLALHNVIHGIEKVLRLFAGLARKPSHNPEVLRRLLIDGLPGCISRDRGNLLQTTALDFRDGRIVGIYIVRNQEQLCHVAAAIGFGGPGLVGYRASPGFKRYSPV